MSRATLTVARTDAIFDRYVAMGPERSLMKLASELRQSYGENGTGVPKLRTLELWSSKYRWDRRARGHLVMNGHICSETARLRHFDRVPSTPGTDGQGFRPTTAIPCPLAKNVPSSSARCHSWRSRSISSCVSAPAATAAGSSRSARNESLKCA